MLFMTVAWKEIAKQKDEAIFWNKMCTKAYITFWSSIFTNSLDWFEVTQENEEEDAVQDGKSITETNEFQHDISGSSFILVLNCARYIFTFASTLAKILQSNSIEIGRAFQAIQLRIE